MFCLIPSIFARINSKVRRLPVFLNFDICESEMCYKDAYNIIASLNASVDPCEDFYEFVCGKWPLQNKRPASEPNWSQWEILNMHVQNNIKNILEVNEKITNNRALESARLLYSSCVDYGKFEYQNAVELKRLLDTYGGWPVLSGNWDRDMAWYEKVANINGDLNVHPLLKFHVSTNLYNTKTHILYIDEPSLIYPAWILLDPVSYKIQIDNYEKWIVNSTWEIARVNKINVSLENVKEQAREVVDFEIQIARLISEKEKHNLSNLYKRITVKKLQKLTNYIPLEHYYNSVSWSKVVESVLGKQVLSIQSVNNIIVKNLVYIIRLIKLIDKTPARVIANYIGWNIVQYFSRDTTQNLSNFIFEVDKSLSGVQAQESREMSCISRINKEMSLAINNAYIEKYFSTDVKIEVNEMLDNIKEELEKKLGSVHWLDGKTKKHAIAKARTMNYLIGYAEVLRNLTYIEEYYEGLKMSDNNVRNIIAWNKFDRQKQMLKLVAAEENSWTTITTDINAYYSVLHNLVIVPAGILQYPFYKMDRLHALNYGAFATILAHEFSHAFDNTGRQVDGNGNLKQWWSQESLANYEKSLQCFEDIYEKFIIDVLNKNFSNQIQIDSQRTQDENIADIIGLEIAYKAYINSNRRTFDMVLPGLEQYSTDQLFFISYANIWCESISEEQLLTQVLEGTHTPNKVRILGAVSQSEDFNKVFSCGAVTRMNPKPKCLL